MKKEKYFRYLEKYVGTYCVRAELDPDTNDFPRNSNGNIYDSFEDLYIPCKRGIIKHTYEKDLLALYFLNGLGTKNNVADEFDKNKIWYEDDSFGPDGLLYFHESDMKKVAKIVVPKTRGNKLSPFSKRTIEKSKSSFEIPAEDMKKYTDITDSISLDKVQKMQFLRKVAKDFEQVVFNKKGSDFNITKQRKENGLNAKELYYYLGMWDEYLDFVQGEMDKR